MVGDLQILEQLIERVLTMEVNLKAKAEEIFDKDFWFNFYTITIYQAKLMDRSQDHKCTDEIMDDSIEQAINLAHKMKKYI